MIVAATLLIAMGVVVSLLGAKLFRLLVPVFGLVTGFMVGFIGLQAVFGANAVSTALAIVAALVVGVVMGVLSYVFVDLAAMFLVIMLGAVAFSYLGVALGLNGDGFVVFLMSLAGAILAGMYVANHAVTLRLVVTITSMLGVAYILTGLMLIVGNVSLDQLHEGGVVRTLLSVVNESFVWLLVWIGGSLFAGQLQYRLAVAAFMARMFEFAENDKQLKRS